MKIIIEEDRKKNFGQCLNLGYRHIEGIAIFSSKNEKDIKLLEIKDSLKDDNYRPINWPSELYTDRYSIPHRLNQDMYIRIQIREEGSSVIEEIEIFNHKGELRIRPRVDMSCVGDIELSFDE